jgi:predicted dithiol-disulfide oxidoreductase (DUF899 family)
MLGPEYVAGCPSCSAIADGFDGSVVHFANHDVTLMAVSRAPLEKLRAYKQRMGWTFPWASSGSTAPRSAATSNTRGGAATTSTATEAARDLANVRRSGAYIERIRKCSVVDHLPSLVVRKFVRRKRRVPI